MYDKPVKRGPKKKKPQVKKQTPEYEKPSSKENTIRPGSGSTDKNTAGRPSSQDDGAYIPEEKPKSKSKKNAKKKVVRPMGYGKDSIQNQIEMRQRGETLQ